MATTSNAATPPTRQSCDRCYSQKLRCTRVINSETGACNRCLRQGAECLYSSSLPKGCPSMYRLAGASPATSNSPPMPSMPVTPVSPGMCRRLPTDPHPAANSNATNTNTNTDGDSKANTHTNVNPNSNTNVNTRVDVNDNTITFGPLEASTWPWQAPLNWSDMLIDGSDHDSNLRSIVDPQTGPGTVFFGDFLNICGSASSRNSDSGSGTQGLPMPPTPRLNEHGHYSGSDVFDVSSNRSISIDRNGSGFGIAQLSQLSTLLYPLYRSSCSLAEAAELSCQLKDRNYSHQSPLIDNVAFKSVTAWLVHVSANMIFLFPDFLQNPSLETTGDTLHNTFSASHHLLEIIRGLQVDLERGILYNTSRASKSSSASTEGGDNGYFWANTTPQSLASAIGEKLSYFEPNNGSSNYVRSPS